jgi:hypothetical protein
MQALPSTAKCLIRVNRTTAPLRRACSHLLRPGRTGGGRISGAPTSLVMTRSEPATAGERAAGERSAHVAHARLNRLCGYNRA